MKILLALSICAFVSSLATAWQPDPNCGIKGPSGKEQEPLGNGIVGGTPAAPHEFPWQVRVGGCGGSVLNARWIVTAAHCYSQLQNGTKLTFGAHYRPELNSTGTVQVGFSKVFHHPNYSFLNDDSDITLVKLSRELPLNMPASLPTIHPICLPEVETDLDALAGRIATVTGWGHTSSGGRLSEILRKVNVTITKQAVCSKAYEEINSIITERQICAADPGKDSCQGDSGGPLATFNAKTGRWQLTGIVSCGKGCADPKYPGVYTRVAKFLDWIKEIIEHN